MAIHRRRYFGHPPGALPRPYKTTSTTLGALHTSPSPSLLLSRAGIPPHRVFPWPLRTAASPGRHAAARAPVRPEPSSPCSPLSITPPPVSFSALEHPEAVLRWARRRAPVPSVRTAVGPRWTVRARPDSPRVDPVHDFIRWKIIRYSGYFKHFALRPLCFSKINPQSKNLLLGPRIWKIFTKRSLASEKIHKNSSKTSKIHIFSTTTPNLVILVPKFSESLPLSFCAFI
jgi:hypothetical protein